MSLLPPAAEERINLPYAASMKQPHPVDPVREGAISRRTFLKGFGTATVGAMASGASTLAAEMESANAGRVLGPGAVPVGFTLNGRAVHLAAEPRETLLDVLRMQLGHTGPKEGCDRGTCGACTVLLDGRPVNACMRLAVEAEGAAIETIEGLAQNGELTAVQRAFVAVDGLQCGFCSPGFIMTVTALLRENPHPTAADVRRACAGNVCRCGSQPHIIKAALRAAGVATTSTADVLHSHHALA